jgi:hypothetical protein
MTDEDPIGTASAGLRALGVAPQRRVETLGLLGALMDLADDRGFVELDSSLMETEERLGIDACLEGYEWLERLDVIRRTWSGWVIQNFEAHAGPVGMTEASLAILQKHLSSAEVAPVPVPVPEPVAVAPVAPIVQLKPWRRRVPAIAATVAAGVAVLAGATQFVPQAAVSTRDVSAHSGAPTSGVAGAVTSAVDNAAPDVATTGPNGATASSGPAVVTTTTSTTLLPGLPCLGDVLRDLGGKTGLRPTATTQNPPGVLPCP